MVQSINAPVDGLILAGGQDVSPILYDEEPTHRLGVTHPARDAFEIALVEAYNQCKPILRFCRGMQLINVAFWWQPASGYPSQLEKV